MKHSVHTHIFVWLQHDAMPEDTTMAVTDYSVQKHWQLLQ